MPIDWSHNTFHQSPYIWNPNSKTTTTPSFQTKRSVYIGSREQDEQWSHIITTSHLFLTANDFKNFATQQQQQQEGKEKKNDATPWECNPTSCKMHISFTVNTIDGKTSSRCKTIRNGKMCLKLFVYVFFSSSPPSSSSLSSSPSWSYYKQQTNRLARYESSVWRGGQIEPHCICMQRRRIKMSARAHAT